MALIEVFHVVANEIPIDPNATPDIPQGSIVALGTDGNVTLCNTSTSVAVGIAGDSRSQGVTSYTPESGSALDRNPGASPLTGALVMGSYQKPTTPATYTPAVRFTQNHVADNYNEVLASGKMTVYMGGGVFWTDMYESYSNAGALITANYIPGTRLYWSDTGNYAPDTEPDNGGRFTTENLGSARTVLGILLAGPLNYPSGVPGTTTSFTWLPEGGNSLTWGSMIEVKSLM